MSIVSLISAREQWLSFFKQTAKFTCKNNWRSQLFFSRAGVPSVATEVSALATIILNYIIISGIIIDRIMFHVILSRCFELSECFCTIKVCPLGGEDSNTIRTIYESKKEALIFAIKL